MFAKDFHKLLSSQICFEHSLAKFHILCTFPEKSKFQIINGKTTKQQLAHALYFTNRLGHSEDLTKVTSATQ